MALPIDHSRALRTLDELCALVEAIRDAPASEPETDCLEWKSKWDLSETAKCFETAKHILGFGNRSVAAARRDFDGCAYLVIGVEPGNLCGTSPLDPAILNGKIGRYVESGAPRWGPHYFAVGGKTVLVITVEAPREGDSICALQKTFGGFSEGRVFIRRHGQTEEAKPADIRELESRLLSTRPQVELNVGRIDQTNIPVVSIPPGLKEMWTGAEQKRLALPPAPQESGIGRHSPLFELSGDPRSREEYRSEVATYMQQVDEHVEAEVIKAVIEGETSALKLEIENPTDRNFNEVEVVLHVPSGPVVWADADEVNLVVGAAPSPKPWGEKRKIELDVSAFSGFASSRPVEIDRNNGGTTVRFDPKHVRPRARVSLPVLHMVLWSHPSDIPISWTLTSSGVDGQASGTFVCSVEDKPLAETLKALT